MNTYRRLNDPVTPGTPPNVTPTSQLSADEIAAIVDAEYRHVDYDRHPLRVQGLDHYIDRPQSAERFHIW